MKKILLALLLLLAPTTALAVTEQQVDMALSRAPACEASVGLMPGELNGYYVTAAGAAAIWGAPGPVIILQGDKVSPEWALLVLLHEAGHCMQDAQGALTPPKWEMEYDADRRGIELAYQLDINPEFLLDAFAYLVKLYGIDVDQWSNHGTVRGRVLHIQKVIRTTIPPEAA